MKMVGWTVVCVCWMWCSASHAGDACSEAVEEQSYQGMIAEGVRLTKAQDYAAALEQFEQAQSRCASDPVVTYAMGRVHHMKADCDTAKALYKLAISQHDNALRDDAFLPRIDRERIASRLAEAEAGCEAGPAVVEEPPTPPELVTQSGGEVCEVSHPEVCLRAGARALGQERPADARDAFKVACKGKKMVGCYELGKLFKKGEGGKKNLLKARQLFKKACKRGHSESCRHL